MPLGVEGAGRQHEHHLVDALDVLPQQGDLRRQEGRHRDLSSTASCVCLVPKGPTGADKGACSHAQENDSSAVKIEQGACEFLQMLKPPRMKPPRMKPLQYLRSHVQWQSGQQHRRAGSAGAHLGPRLAGRGGVEGQRHNKGVARLGVAHNVELMLRSLHMNFSGVVVAM